MLKGHLEQHGVGWHHADDRPLLEKRINSVFVDGKLMRKPASEPLNIVKMMNFFGLAGPDQII